MEPLETIKYKNCLINIYADEQPESPRDWDNFGNMFCKHNDYKLGDDFTIDTDDCEDWEDVAKELKKQCNAEILIPLYLYDHSGITMNTTGFSCGWDSGQVGWIYCTKEDRKKEGLTPTKARKLMVSEVKDYDYYITGNVYGFEAKDSKGEFIDSCWGFLGDLEKSGLMDTAKDNIDYYLKKQNEKKTKKLKALIKNKVNINNRQLLLI